MFQSGPGAAFQVTILQLQQNYNPVVRDFYLWPLPTPRLWNGGKPWLFNHWRRGEAPRRPPFARQCVHAGLPEHRHHVTCFRLHTKVFADGCVSWFPAPRLRCRGRAADTQQTVLTHGCALLCRRWLPGGGACSLQQECECVCVWAGLRLGTLLPPYCSGGSVPAAAPLVALLVYVCVRAQECPDHGLFTKQPFGCPSRPPPPNDMLTQLLQEKAKMVMKKQRQPS